MAKAEFHFGELFRGVGFTVTNLEIDSWAAIRFCNKRGTSEQWINEGKQTVLPRWNDSCSLTSLQQRLVKMGGRLLKPARYYWLLLANSHLTRRLFGAMPGRIEGPSLPAG